jgi:phosphoglycerate dehydrogenase-like enzyme
MPKIVALPNVEACASLFSVESWQTLRSLGDVVANTDSNSLSDEKAAELLTDADVCITSWGSPQLSGGVIFYAPDLKLHCHAAGTVKPYVSDALWSRGVMVTSASAAIAVDVAQTTLGWMIIAAKRALVANIATHEGGWKGEMTMPAGDLTGSRIGIIGASHVGREVIKLLKPFDVEIMLYDPYVSAEGAEELGTEKLGLRELLETSDIVSLHVPNTPETKNMLNSHNLPLMKDGAAFINTARGASVDEDALVKELETGRIWAFIDVTDPEPPAANHAFRRLPNVVLTPHIAGCVGRGRKRIGEYVVEEVRRFVAGEPQRYQITREMLHRIG